MPKNQASWALSVRTSFLVLLPLFAAVLEVGPNNRSDVSARDTVQVLAGDLFRDVSHQTVASKRTHPMRRSR